MPRNVWFNDLLYVVNQGSLISLAIHINQQWANDICAWAKIPNIVLDWMQLEKSHNKPLIKRI